MERGGMSNTLPLSATPGVDYTTTPNYGFYKPVYDMDEGTWGDHINANSDQLDSLLLNIEQGYLPLNGAAVSGDFNLTTTGFIWMQSEDGAAAASGAVGGMSGSPAAGFASGDVWWGTGDATNADTGLNGMQTGNATNGTSGQLNLVTGAADGAGHVSGDVYIRTGPVTNGAARGKIVIDANQVGLGTGNGLKTTVTAAGDVWFTLNAYFDGANWQRDDTSKYAYAMVFQTYSSIVGEEAFGGNTGLLFLRCVPGSNPISATWWSSGGWENSLIIDQFRHLVVGGQGIEVDGAGSPPFGRLTHTAVSGSGNLRTGILSNMYVDFSDVDSNTAPSWFAGRKNDTFVVERAAAGGATEAALTELLRVSTTGQLTIGADPTTALQAATKQYVDAAAAAIPSRNVGRNYIHNGTFRIWQRGNGPFSGNIYTADRWVLGTSTDTSTVSRAATSDTMRSQVGDEEAQVALSCSVVSAGAAGSSTFVCQRIEDPRRLSGKTVAVSFYAYSGGAAGLKVGVSVDQSFGTGGSPSATVVGAGTLVPLSSGTTWARYSTTLTLPSTAGKTFGTNNNGSTILNLWLSAGSNFNSQSGSLGIQNGATISLWGVQLELGSVATPLEKPDLAREMENCQRFFFSGTVYAIGYGQAGGQVYGTYFLPVAMQRTPGGTLTGASYANASALTQYAVTPTTYVVQATVTATGQASGTAALTLSADL
jgi:hypothetical protein